MFTRDRAKKDLSRRDVSGRGREGGKANGSCGMLMARSLAPALYLQPEPIMANSTAIY